MSVAMRVKESETGLVRLFAVDLEPRDALDLKERPGLLPALLGVEDFAAGQWELFDLTDLAGLGLEGYLAEGHGISEDALEPHRWTLDALEGVVLILRSAALTERPVTLTPRAPLRWIATFGEETAPVPLRSDLPSASARGTLALPPEPMPRQHGLLVLLILGILLTGAIAVALTLVLS